FGAFPPGEQTCRGAFPRLSYVESMVTLRLPRPRGFSLQAAAEFHASFTPGSGMASSVPDGLTLAFRLDRTFEAVAVSMREEGESFLAECVGTRDGAAVGRQVARMLG